MPSVERAAVVTHGARRTSSAAVERRARQSPSAPASSCRSRTSGGNAGHRHRARRRRDDAARARAAFSARRPRARRQLRPRRVPHGDRGRGRARGRPRPRVRGRATASSSCRRSRSSSTATRHVAVNDVVVASATLGRMIELELLDRRRGSRRPAMRRPDLRDAARLDGVQPLERRARCSSGASTRWCVTFVAPHTLHARPLVVARGADLVVDEPQRRRARPACSSTATAVGRLEPGRPGHRAPRPGSAAGSRPARADVLPPLRRTSSRPPCTDSRRGQTASVRWRRCCGALRIENLVLIREAELELDGGPERDHRRDRRGQDDPLERDRAAARRARATRPRSARPAARRTSRPSSTCPTTTRSASSPSCGRRARRRSCSPGGSSPTAGRARTRGAAARRARTSRPRSRRCSR